MKKRVLSMLLVLVMVCIKLPIAGHAEGPVTLVSHGIAEITDRGNVLLNLTSEAVFEKFAFGDVVTVTMGDLTVDMPILDGYSVDAGLPEIYMYDRAGKKEVRLVCNMQKFASVYHIAYQPDAMGNPTEWVYNEGFSADMDVTITMKEKAGYLKEYQIRSMVYTDNREDYPNLTDEEFGNFRMVSVGEIAPGVLYRSASPIHAGRGRNTYVDAAAQQAGVTVFFNLVNSEEDEAQEEGFAGSYYAQQKRICVAATMDFTLDENRQKLADGLRFMAENPGVYDIFCKEGKDRTGYVLVLLEGLMSATAEEMERDYMLSFYNYYGTEPGSEAYDYLINGNFVKITQMNMGADPRDSDFQQKVESYLKELGLTDAEITQLKTNLAGGKAPAQETEITEEPTAEETVEEKISETQAPTAPAVTKSGDRNPVSIVIALVLLVGLSWLAWKRKK